MNQLKLAARLAPLIVSAMVFSISPVVAQIQPVKIGISTSLTGETAAMGLDIKDALEFANQDLLEGRYSFDFQDDRCDKVQAISVAKKFTTINRYSTVMGILCNNSLIAAAPTYDRAGTLVIATGATTGDLRGLGPMLFRIYPADNLAAAPLVGLVKSRYKKVAVLTELDEYTALMERAFQRGLAGSAVKVYVEQHQPGTADYRSSLLKFKQSGVEAIFLNPLGEPGYINMVRQVKQLKLDWTILANVVPGSGVVRKELGSLDSGVVFSELPLNSEDLPPAEKAIWERFIRQYGPRRSSSAINFVTIDALRLFDAARSSGQPVAQYLRTAKFKGLSGEVSFDDDGARSGINFVLYRISASGTIQPFDAAASSP